MLDSWYRSLGEVEENLNLENNDDLPLFNRDELEALLADGLIPEPSPNHEEMESIEVHPGFDVDDDIIFVGSYMQDSEVETISSSNTPDNERRNTYRVETHIVDNGRRDFDEFPENYMVRFGHFNQNGEYYVRVPMVISHERGVEIYLNDDGMRRMSNTLHHHRREIHFYNDYRSGGIANAFDLPAINHFIQQQFNQHQQQQLNQQPQQYDNDDSDNETIIIDDDDDDDVWPEPQDRTISSEPRCPICLENLLENDPIVPRCGHAVCLRCMVQSHAVNPRCAICNTFIAGPQDCTRLYLG